MGRRYQSVALAALTAVLCLGLAACGGGETTAPLGPIEGYWQLVESISSRGARQTYENGIIELRAGRFRSNVDDKTATYTVEGNRLRMHFETTGASVTFTAETEPGKLTLTQPGYPTRMTMTGLTDEAGAAAFARPGRATP